jgi:hypothetical protein
MAFDNDTPLATNQIADDLAAMNTNWEFLLGKGGDITSANPLVIDTDGMYFDVTGTTNFATMTVQAGRFFVLQFDDVITMTHHGTNLDLPSEANITTAAGDVGLFVSTGANTVQCIAFTRAAGTPIVIADDSIDSQHYAADSIDTEHYAPGSVDSTAMAAYVDGEYRFNTTEGGGSYYTCTFTNGLLTSISGPTEYIGGP